MDNSEESLSFDVMGIQECQRNRYPLLFIDQITKAIPGKSANGLKSFTYNEWFFPAHFDDEPNVPGFIQVECLVQTFLMS
ncbi:MAG: beta-hydroxyacyl-ACP dehydratase, partial [Candidatus Cloacimonetes bacterium]|nr:beta-hydroxyacyl-ACP dehydratase [Candidatus Cloacimonadota bacterium]